MRAWRNIEQLILQISAGKRSVYFVTFYSLTNFTGIVFIGSITSTWRKNETANMKKTTSNKKTGLLCNCPQNKN